jgi:hypothetical protein
MLRISTIDTRSQRKLVVEGALIEPWVAELHAAGRVAKQELGERELLIDLCDVTVISVGGEEAIFDLTKEGKLFCPDVLTKEVLKQLARRKEREATSAKSRSRFA